MNSIDWKNATPEQLNFWRIASAKIAWNTVTPMFYEGPIAAAEFTVFAATKIYVALEFEIYDRLGAASATVGTVTLYDQADAVMTYLRQNGLALTAADANRHAIDPMILKNYWFSRIATSGYSQMKFNGYKLTQV